MCWPLQLVPTLGKHQRQARAVPCLLQPRRVRQVKQSKNVTRVVNLWRGVVLMRTLLLVDIS